MKLIHRSPSCLLHLLLLAELFARSSPRPAPGLALCRTFRSMSHHVNQLMDASKSLHKLTEEELQLFAEGAGRLVSFPAMPHTPDHIRALQVNQSLSQLYVHAEAFRLHIDWLRTAKDNVSVPSQPVEGASLHVLKLCQLVKTTLQQMDEDVPAAPSASPSFPVVSSAFDALLYSVEMSERLHAFCDWSKRILRQVQVQTRCPRH